MSARTGTIARFRELYDYYRLAGAPPERSTTDAGERILSFTLITTTPNRLLRDIGHHRAPLMIEPAQRRTWLGGSDEQAERRLISPPSDEMDATAVPTRANNPNFAGPALPKNPVLYENDHTPAS